MKCGFCGLAHNPHKPTGWKCMPERLAETPKTPPDHRYYEQLLKMSEFVSNAARAGSGKIRPYRFRFANILRKASEAMKAIEKADRNECGYIEDDVIRAIQAFNEFDETY